MYGKQLVTLASGEFYCPHCADFTRYEIRQFMSKRFLLLIFPVRDIPVGVPFIECGRCSSHFDRSVFDYRPKDPNQVLLIHAHRALLAGGSIGLVQGQLVERGYAGPNSEKALLDICKGKVKTCSCGRRYHPAVYRCEECNRSL